MPDPRILRTRVHILEVLRELLARPGEEITFTTLALRARVSRRTLYTHWGTVEAAVADASFGTESSPARDSFLQVSDDLMRNLPAVIAELESLRDAHRTRP